MRRIWLIFLALVLVSAWVVGCSDDIILESGSDLAGDYGGFYLVIENYGGDEIVKKQPITWKFTDSSYVMQIDVHWDCDSFENSVCVDSSEGWDVTFSTCRVDGKYALSDAVNLLELHSLPDGEAGFTACNSKNNPNGSFTLIKSGSSDTLRMTKYDDVAKVFKEIRIALIK